MKNMTIEKNKSIIDFYKTLTGLATGSILLVVNFLAMYGITEFAKTCCIIKVLILSVLLCFTVSGAFGIFTIRYSVNKLQEDFNYTPYTLSIIISFSLGYLLLLSTIAILLFPEIL